VHLLGDAQDARLEIDMPAIGERDGRQDRRRRPSPVRPPGRRAPVPQREPRRRRGADRDPGRGLGRRVVVLQHPRRGDRRHQPGGGRDGGSQAPTVAGADHHGQRAVQHRGAGDMAARAAQARQADQAAARLERDL